MRDFLTMLKKYCRDLSRDGSLRIIVHAPIEMPKFTDDLSEFRHPKTETHYLGDIRRYYQTGRRPIYRGQFTKGFKEFVRKREFTW